MVIEAPVEMSDGVVLIDCPTSDANGALDHSSFRLTGGFLVAVGSAGMAQAPSSTSTQRSVKITYSQWKSAGTLIHIERSSSGAELLTFEPAKVYRSCVFSPSSLQSSTTYKLHTGGSSTGSDTDGLYESGTYTPGTLTETFVASGTVTSVYSQ